MLLSPASPMPRWTSYIFGRPSPRAQVERIALVAGLIAGAVLAGLVGWLGFRTYEAQNRETQRYLFVQTAEDVAVNLSTVDYQHADADAQRILDSATGRVRRQLLPPQAVVHRRRQADAVEIAGCRHRCRAGIANGDQGRVLVAVTVKSADPAQAGSGAAVRADAGHRAEGGRVAKVSDVAFVS